LDIKINQLFFKIFTRVDEEAKQQRLEQASLDTPTG